MSKKFCMRSLLLVLAILATGGVAWVFVQAREARDGANPARARKRDQPHPVRTEMLSEKEMEHVIGGTAVTVPQEVAVIRAGSAARKAGDPASDLVIKTRYVENGSHVKRGQVLFEVDDELFRQILKERELARDSARAELERVKESLQHNQKLRDLGLASAQEGMAFRNDEMENRKEALKVAEGLFKKGAMGLLEWYEARIKNGQARYEHAEAQRTLQRAQIALSVGPLADQVELARAAANFDVAQIEFEVARAKVARCQIKSPIEGFVSQVSVIPGQVVEDNAVIAQVLKLDPVHVRMDFPQESAGDIVLGQKAEVVLDSFPKETFVGTVIRMTPQVNSELRVLPDIIELNNPQHRINLGVSGFVRLRQTRKTLAVPAQAVFQRGSKAMVFRVEEGKARLREVRTGALVETGLLEVKHGLAAGEEVVVFHNFYLSAGNLSKANAFLQDNDPVDPNWRVWARRE